MNFKSIKDLSYDIRTKLLPKIPKDVGLVLGIPRSGMLPASILATLLGVPLAAVGETPRVGARGSLFRSKGKKALLVDDSIYGGAAMYRGLQKASYYTCITCAIYVHPQAVDKVTLYAEVLDGPRMFEWNFLGIKATESYMFDMDGVICTDPAVFDNDGSSYENEICRGVRPFLLPQLKICGICTNRIERWRSVTEEWLNKHGVLYDKLIMQPYDTAVERRKKSFAPEYKAYHFNASDATVFVESHYTQAVEIAKRTSKEVLCVETMSLVSGQHSCLLNINKRGICMLCGKKVNYNE